MTDGGQKSFLSCSEVLNQDANKIISRDFKFFVDMRQECKALEIYQKSVVNNSKKWIYNSLGTLISKKTLPRHTESAPPEENVLIPGVYERDGNLRAEIVFDEYALDYRVLAKGNFMESDSESENLLILLNWKVLDAFGVGSSLYILEKADSGPARVVPVLP